MGFKEWIIPQDRVFFDLLERHAAKCMEASNAFRKLLSDWSNMDAHRATMKEIENAADAIGHETFERLTATFITPIDREDIARLAHALDDIVDSIYAATNRITLYDIGTPTTPMTEFVEILEKQIAELQSGIAALRKPNAMAKLMPKHSVEIHRLENLADRRLNTAVAELFTHTDAVHIIKHKEIYEFLEGATDRCEDVADILQDIVRKHG